MAGYTAVLLPRSGKRSLLRILIPPACARQALVDRIPSYCAATRPCSIDPVLFSMGTAIGGWKLREGKLPSRMHLRGTAARVEIYRVSNAGHMLLVENPTECVNSLVHSLLGRSSGPLPVRVT